MAADHHLGEPADVVGDVVEVRAACPHLLESDLVVGVEGIGVAQQHADDVADGRGPRHGGRGRGQRPERAQ